jgi:hypothetical protein
MVDLYDRIRAIHR